MVTAPLMVTVRNARGRAMLRAAVEAGRVEVPYLPVSPHISPYLPISPHISPYLQVLQEGGHGGRRLPSAGDRRLITMKTVEGDSMVKSLTDAAYVRAEQRRFRPRYL